MSKITRCRSLFMLVAILWAAGMNLSLSAQDKAYKNSVSVTFSTLRVFTTEQYIGAGLEYRLMPKRWLGFKVQATKFPQDSTVQTPYAGGPLLQETASVLLGHRLGKIAIYAEGGGGVVQAHVFKGFLTSTGTEYYDVRHYPDIVMGGFADVSVGRRWSVTFAVHDSLVIFPPYTVFGGSGAYPGFSGTNNCPEGRAGIALHF